MTRVLAADVGGTKTALTLYEGEPGAWSVARSDRYESRGFSGLLPILGEFLRGERVDAAGFGVPGPVQHGICHTTNLPWVVVATDVQHICGTDRVMLLNDVQAAVLGVHQVSEEQRVWLQQAPIIPEAPVSLVAVGTGFGRAFMVPPGRAFATEGGHATFAPRNNIERRLLAFLSERHERVSVEHVLSGPGVRALYDFVVAEGLAPPTALLEIERAEDPSAEIGRLGARDLDQACAAVVAFFADLLGSELGNVALQTLPRGGLYLWGGVALKLRSVFEEGDLLDAFLDKDRMREVLETIPLALLDAPDLGLLGAREAALSLLA